MALNAFRVYVVLEYLQRGGKVELDGRTYVWLDNYIVRETEDQLWVIDGLATEGVKFRAGEDWNDPAAGEPHYMGQGDTPISQFLKMVDEIPDEKFHEICSALQYIRGGGE